MTDGLCVKRFYGVRETAMRYWRVLWTDAEGEHFSDPIEKWTSAELYRREIGGDAELLRY